MFCFFQTSSKTSRSMFCPKHQLKIASLGIGKHCIVKKSEHRPPLSAQELYDEFGLRIWLTEVACPFARKAEEIEAFMAELLPRLEAADHVARYAWFATRFPTQVERPTQKRLTYLLQDWGQYWYLSSENSLLQPNLSARTPLGDLYMTSACPSTAREYPDRTNINWRFIVGKWVDLFTIE